MTADFDPDLPHKNTQRTSQMTASSAQICRDFDWGPGTLLEDAERPCNRLRITAVGRTIVLAEMIADAGGPIDNPCEGMYSLAARDWRRI